MRLDGFELPSFRHSLLRFVGNTQQDVACKLGVTKQAVSRWLKRDLREESINAFLEEVLADIDVRVLEAAVNNVLTRRGVDVKKDTVLKVGEDEFIEL
jgi:predicted transcriptional regulator